MAQIHLLPLQPHLDGAERLASDLERAFAAGEHLGPRWAQICACGLGLQHACEELRPLIDEMMSGLTPTPEVEAFRASLHELADALLRLAIAAQSMKNVA